MGWRIIYIEEAIRLNYKLNSLGVLHNDEVTWICLDEIDMILIESMACNTSIRLLAELSDRGIALIVCGENHLPIGMLNSFSNNQRTAKYNRIQIDWTKHAKQNMWKEIVKRKIAMQTKVLVKLGKCSKVQLLMEYYDNVEPGDLTNREGHAAKIYFHELFGMNFVRTRNANDIINSSLNYAYQIVRSKISQEIIAHGYSPIFGIFHCSEYNYYGFADDLIEVYRPIVDFIVISLLEMHEVEYLTADYKKLILSSLYTTIKLGSTRHKLLESVKYFVNDTTEAICSGSFESVAYPDFIDDK